MAQQFRKTTPAPSFAERYHLSLLAPFLTNSGAELHGALKGVEVGDSTWEDWDQACIDWSDSIAATLSPNPEVPDGG
jgi:hypothetical protein